jgi:broad specificity phosphatase PhoE
MKGIESMIWYFLRHAEKETGDFYNPRLRHQDRPLSEKGHKDAQKLVGYFADKKLAAIYVSGYSRTYQTIQPVASELDLVPIVDERLNEIDNGLVDEMTEVEFKQAYPQEWSVFKARSADFRYPGGETGLEAQRRVVDFAVEKLAQHRGENILVVSHDGLIRLWICHILGIPVYKRGIFQVDSCGLVEVNYLQDEECWKLIRFNQVCG